MKPETYFKKAMEIEDPNIRLSKLETICLRFLPHSLYWEKAQTEAHKLRQQGYKYW